MVMLVTVHVIHAHLILNIVELQERDCEKRQYLQSMSDSEDDPPDPDVVKF